MKKFTFRTKSLVFNSRVSEWEGRGKKNEKKKGKAAKEKCLMEKAVKEFSFLTKKKKKSFLFFSWELMEERKRSQHDCSTKPSPSEKNAEKKLKRRRRRKSVEHKLWDHALIHHHGWNGMSIISCCLYSSALYEKWKWGKIKCPHYCL